MMQNIKRTEIFIPDNTEEEKAIKRTTHMTIAAHQDDIEIMAYEGIADCFGRDDMWHFGIVVTDGAGSPRKGIYADYSDEQMQQIRKKEQKKAAYVGEFGALAMLDYSSSDVKDSTNTDVINEIAQLILAANPNIIYTHNLADKHDTHVGVAIKVIKALRQLDSEHMPKAVYGCEVWRDLDWVCDNEKVIMDADKRSNIASSLVGVFDSQICGGKRYDLAAIARRKENATFSQSHATDESSAINYAIDLTPLIIDKDMDIEDYIVGYIRRFMDSVTNKIRLMI